MAAGLLTLVFLISVSSATDVHYANTTLVGRVLFRPITGQSRISFFPGIIFSGEMVDLTVGSIFIR